MSEKKQPVEITIFRQCLYQGQPQKVGTKLTLLPEVAADFVQSGRANLTNLLTAEQKSLIDAAKQGEKLSPKAVKVIGKEDNKEEKAA